jgi:hypothetical protein
MININNNLSPFQFFCQKVIPTVFDDSLSYYELLTKVVKQLNDVMEAQNLEGDAITELQTLFVELKNYVDNYFDTTDFQNLVNSKLDEMVLDGTLGNLINDVLLADINTKVDDLVSDNLLIKEDIESHTQDIASITEVNNKLNERVNQIYLNILDYKHLVPDVETLPSLNDGDWTEAIKQALEDASDFGETGKMPVIYFPWFGTGEYKTDPIDMIGYNNIVLQGGGAEIHKNIKYLWGDENRTTKYVRIHFITPADVGFKTASTVNPYVGEVEYCHGMTFKNLWLYGGNNVNKCINGNYNFTMENMFCSHALENCVVLEDFTYPCKIKDCNFGFFKLNHARTQGHFVYLH